VTEPFDIAFLNGRFGALSSLSLPVLDRGFLFGDAVYEVVPVYDGRVFRGDSHFDRLQHSLDGIRLDNPLRREDWNELLANVIQRNGAGSMAVYLQISRGAGSGRDHRIKPGLAPTVFAMAMPLADRSAARKKGVAAITADDIRWARCDIKSTALLANVLLASDAGRAGAEETLLLRNGLLHEGASSSVLIVTNGSVRMPPYSHRLLPGTTRDLVVALLAADGTDICEQDVPEQELRHADEIWIASATREVLPVTSLDGKAVGDGRPGPLWRRVNELYQRCKENGGEIR